MVNYMEKYIKYINNCGGKVSVSNFDDDFEPIGTLIRAKLINQGLIIQSDNVLTIHV